MTEIELKAKLSAKKANLLELCGDSREAIELLAEIISLKGQIETKPTRIHITEDSVKDEIKQGSFYLAKTNKEIIFHLYGGYTVIVDEPIDMSGTVTMPDEETPIAAHGFKTLFDTLDFYFEMKEKYDGFTQEEKDNIDTLILATSHLLQLPTYAFYEDEFAIDIATRGVAQLRHLYEKYMEKAEEEIKENEV